MAIGNDVNNGSDNRFTPFKDYTKIYVALKARKKAEKDKPPYFRVKTKDKDGNDFIQQVDKLAGKMKSIYCFTDDKFGTEKFRLVMFDDKLKEYLQIESSFSQHGCELVNKLNNLLEQDFYTPDTEVFIKIQTAMSPDSGYKKPLTDSSGNPMYNINVYIEQDGGLKPIFLKYSAKTKEGEKIEDYKKILKVKTSKKRAKMAEFFEELVDDILEDKFNENFEKYLEPKGIKLNYIETDEGKKTYEYVKVGGEVEVNDNKENGDDSEDDDMPF